MSHVAANWSHGLTHLSHPDVMWVHHLSHVLLHLHFLAIPVCDQLTRHVNSVSASMMVVWGLPTMLAVSAIRHARPHNLCV